MGAASMSCSILAEKGMSRYNEASSQEERIYNDAHYCAWFSGNDCNRNPALNAACFRSIGRDDELHRFAFYGDYICLCDGTCNRSNVCSLVCIRAGCHSVVSAGRRAWRHYVYDALFDGTWQKNRLKTETSHSGCLQSGYDTGNGYSDKKILKGTLIVEGAGAILYMTVFIPEFGWIGIWKSVFNAISAFCNAEWMYSGLIVWRPMWRILLLI